MSGIEVVAAVSAVISAFHGGSELLKHIKTKRRTRKARDQAQQEFEEKQLQDSLMTGEQQIGLRYTQDMRELGDLMRVGDVVARDSLFHIAITLQAEVIKSLQLACQHESAVLNLRLLHEASILNRKDTFVTLDDLKQRILITRPMARQLKGAPEGLRPRQSTASVQTVLTNNYSPVSHIPDNYIPPAVTLPSQEDPQDAEHGLRKYFRLKRKNSTPTSPASNTSTHATNVNFSEALEELVRSRGSEDRSVIMKDIDEMISSYQGLHVNNQPSDSWGNIKYNGGYSGRWDTTPLRDGQESYQNNTTNLSRDSTRIFNNLQPMPKEYRAGNQPGYPTFNRTNLDVHQEQHIYNQQYAAKKPFPQIQAQAQMSRSRLSDVSISSSTLSNTPSLNRNSSNSSQDLNTNKPSLPEHFPSNSMSPGLSPHSAQYNASSYENHDEDDRIQSPRFAPYAPSEENYPSSIAPLAPQRAASQANTSPQTIPQLNSPAKSSTISRDAASSPVHKPWPGSQQHRDSFPIASYTPPPLPQQYSPSIEEEHVNMFNSIQPQLQHQLIQPVLARNTSSLHSSSNKTSRTMTPSGFAAISAAATQLCTPPNHPRHRHPSIAASIASTSTTSSNDSNSCTASIGILPGSTRLHTRLSLHPTTTLRTATIQSLPPTHHSDEKPMSGRPHKANNYWGFCKGAWTTRESAQKGLAIRTQPSGLYNTRQIWECVSCTFQGEVFTTPHPVKKNKSELVVDQRIHVSLSGIRYRWIFLAKSHVKKKVAAVASDGFGVGQESHYGCVLCCVEGNVTSVYGGVESLMNHIALRHVADMSERTRRKVNCILGKVAGKGEDWDLNVPIFEQVDGFAPRCGSS